MFALLSGLLFPPGVWAEALPEPLTLEAVLQWAEQAPARYLDASEAQLRLRAARHRQAQAQDDWQLRLQAEATWVEPSVNASLPGDSDHLARLQLEKRLYDFGLNAAQTQASERYRQADELRAEAARVRLRIELMRAYFDVLLADLENRRDSERLSIVFIRFDRLRELQAFGKASELDVAQAEARFQQVRADSIASGAAQRRQRNRLALLLDRPQQLPSDLVRPDLPGLEHKPPAFETLISEVLAHNAEWRARDLEVQAARDALEAARHQLGARLLGRVEYGQYEREFGGRDQARATLALEWPLYQGGRQQALRALAAAQLQQAQQRRQAWQYQLRQRTLELVQRIESLQAQRQADQSEDLYREYYLDRSRGLYELEVRSDLGDAMVEFSAARLRAARTEFELALAWARLYELQGRVFDPFMGGEKE